MSIDTASSLTAPRPAHRLDEARLLDYLRAAVPQVVGSSATPQLLVQQFGHGQSNPTYLVTLNGHYRLVLRKKPPGKVLASAHAVDREYRVLQALSATATAGGVNGGARVPVPRPVALCDDASVLGTPFYLMEFADGRVFVDPNLPGCSAAQRGTVYSQMAATLAALHAVDPAAVGLDDYGAPSGYCARQLRRWEAQYAASVDGRPLPEMMHLLAWLKDHVPAADRHGGGGGGPSSSTCLVHGDYRLDNLVFDPRQLRVIAVLDWELSSRGDPWSDVAYNCMAYHLPPDLPFVAKLTRTGGNGGGLAPGIPTEAEYLANYCAARSALRGSGGGAAVTVVPPSPTDWAFYLGLSIFRLAAILAGVGARARQGTASSANAAAAGSDDVQRSLAAAALRITTASCPSPPPPPSAPSCARPPPGGVQASGRNNGAAASSSFGLPPGGSSSGNGGGPQLSPSAVSAAASWQDPISASSSSSSFPGSGSSSGLSGSGRAAELARLKARLEAFMAEHVYPAEAVFDAHARSAARWTVHPLNESLKAKAVAAGLWNLWLPAPLAQRLTHLLPHVTTTGGDNAAQLRSVLLGAGLSHAEYAPLCEVMGRSVWAPEIFNCSAPDTGNMEVLAKYGSRQQQVTWLLPLLTGACRSCFAMTEKAVASSDATNVAASFERCSDGSGGSSPADGGSIGGGGVSYRVNGLKWWTSGAMDPRCRVAIVMGRVTPQAPDTPAHRQQSMVLVPMSSPGVTVLRPLTVLGFDDAPHGHAEVAFRDVVVPAAEALLLGEGRGFEIAQGRLGPGRLHHCMRLVGMAQRSMELMAARAASRVVFGAPLAKQGGFQEKLGRCRAEVEAARCVVLEASRQLDEGGFKAARGAIGTAKVLVPEIALRVIDAAIQAHGGAGVSQDTPLASFLAAARTLRIADGPDEVHLGTLAKLQMSEQGLLTKGGRKNVPPGGDGESRGTARAKL